MAEKIKIVTHGSKFHTDDIFAVATLQILLGEENTEVIRSRDMEVIEKGDYVVDVGLVYNPKTNRFDHHMNEGAGKRENGIPYASFGLVWKEFGEIICGNKEVADKIDQILVQPIDATDNGVKIIETKFKDVNPYDIGLFFNAFMPGLSEGSSDFDRSFMEAVAIAKVLLGKEISKRNDLLKIKLIVEDVYKKTDDKRLIIFDKYYPAGGFLSNLPESLFYVMPSSDNNWMITTIALDSESNSFKDRKSLPSDWAGKSGEEIEKITGIEGAMFCHNNLFIATAKTREAILKMAEIALNS